MERLAFSAATPETLSPRKKYQKERLRPTCSNNFSWLQRGRDAVALRKCKDPPRPFLTNS
ncbi:hypothetical protein RB213_016126 [Colletotrichum asianum]